MFFRSICTGPASRLTARTFLAGTTCPVGVLNSTSPTSEISSRSASRSRTTTGYSVPRSRNCAAVVPATFVWIVVATLLTDIPSIAAFGRSTRMAISGRPSSRPMFTSASPGVFSMTPRTSCATRRASSRSWPRISTWSRLEPPLLFWPPPLRNRMIWLLPPAGLARTATPGRPWSSRRSAKAISSLVRVRSSRGTRINRI